ncbi:transglycosylase SLT domain-containing protein [Thermomicrobium sp. 4228-Ro]|uniref:transglycosylase SLT domain-containing protein n=1 Tax=Thermomicrobium sp. 4228-Ro TaxID=2993937 RepID=UPI002249070C|nr:transglycosylase SLT domain-containing protein [Thermomicrobium sp. 4228-Ro]MCX2726960.1 transglycosylase SLT domain-containing protein [Thermomicrobium sp. 4228-Ro]
MRALPIRLLVLGVFLVLQPPAALAAQVGTDTFDPTTAQPAVAALWVTLDGGVRYQEAGRSWILGPAIRAVATEPYADAQNGTRTVYYFDKARVEVADPTTSDPRHGLTLGLLVRDMVLGVIQVGDDRFVPVAPAEIPLAGDLENNEHAPTYASLHRLATIGTQAEARRAPARIGQPVTALLARDGSVFPDAVRDSSVRIETYDTDSGHNIPGIFWQWFQAQPLPWLVLTGRPISEPYWVRTRVEGQERLVLVQAFERRVLTYDPQNPDGWRVEWGNAGLHYRVWRGLTAPIQPDDLALASGVPFGEVLVRAARAHGLDPYLFAAVAAVTSHFDPLAETLSGRGLLLAPRAALAGEPYPFDPTRNAERAAAYLASLVAQHGTEAGLAAYLTATGRGTSGEAVRQAADALRQRFPAGTHPLRDRPLVEIGRGHAAYYDPSYSTAWWERTLAAYADWGGAVAGAAPDPNGFYCVHPDFRPGERLLLVANGTALWCTIGDTVAAGHVASWRSRWVIELSWLTFVALGLDRNNDVTVWAPAR